MMRFFIWNEDREFVGESRGNDFQDACMNLLDGIEGFDPKSLTLNGKGLVEE